jgi:hypothetical protein
MQQLAASLPAAIAAAFPCLQVAVTPVQPVDHVLVTCYCGYEVHAHAATLGSGIRTISLSVNLSTTYQVIRWLSMVVNLSFHIFRAQLV